MANTWLRLYHDFLTDEKIIQLAFEDQRHYIGILILKSNGTLDKSKNPELLNKIVAQTLWIGHDAIREVKQRLLNVGLIDENWQPLGWDNRQYASDVSTERVKKFRDKKRQEAEKISKNNNKENETQVKRFSNVSRNEPETLHDRFCNGLDTDTDTETEDNFSVRERTRASESVPEKLSEAENITDEKKQGSRKTNTITIEVTHSDGKTGELAPEVIVTPQARSLAEKMRQMMIKIVPAYEKVNLIAHDHVAAAKLLRKIDEETILEMWSFAITNEFWRDKITYPRELEKNWLKIYQAYDKFKTGLQRCKIDLHEDDDWLSPLLISETNEQHNTYDASYTVS